MAGDQAGEVQFLDLSLQPSDHPLAPSPGPSIKPPLVITPLDPPSSLLLSDYKVSLVAGGSSLAWLSFECLVLASSDNSIQVWKLSCEEGKTIASLVQCLKSHHDAILSLRSYTPRDLPPSNEGGGKDQTVRLWALDLNLIATMPPLPPSSAAISAPILTASAVPLSDHVHLIEPPPSESVKQESMVTRGSVNEISVSASFPRVDLSLDASPPVPATGQATDTSCLQTIPMSDDVPSSPQSHSTHQDQEQQPVELKLVNYDSSPPEQQIVSLVWQRDLRGAVEAAVKHGLMRQDLARLVSGLGGGRAGRAAAVLCAQQEKQAKGKGGRGWKGGIHTSALHLLATAKGESGRAREAVSELYARAGLKLD